MVDTAKTDWILTASLGDAPLKPYSSGSSSVKVISRSLPGGANGRRNHTRVTASCPHCSFVLIGPVVCCQTHPDGSCGVTWLRVSDYRPVNASKGHDRLLTDLGNSTLRSSLFTRVRAKKKRKPSLNFLKLHFDQRLLTKPPYISVKQWAWQACAESIKGGIRFMNFKLGGL